MSARTTIRSLLVLRGLIIALGLVAPAAAQAGTAGRSAGSAQPRSSEKEQLRAKWENRIVFFGEEDTGTWSLRVPDRDATEPATVRYTEMWKYDPAAKKWVKTDDGAAAARIMPAKEKPPTSPPDTQLIATLPLKQSDVGLYYAKWRVNDEVDGATFCRLGPGLTGAAAKEAAEHPPKAPPGMIVTPVPLSATKVELQVIPDPRVSTGQAGAATRPSDRSAR